MITPTVIGLATIMHEAVTLNRDESHALVSAWIAELSPAEARGAVEGLTLLLHALADQGGVDLDEWLQHIGPIFAAEASA